MFNTTTCALVASKLAACEKHVPVWFEQNTFTRVLCVLVIFVTGLSIGCACAVRMRPLTRVLYLYAFLLVIYASGFLVGYAGGKAGLYSSQ